MTEGDTEVPAGDEPEPRVALRCHWCGCGLADSPPQGDCPECGREYTAASARRLKPWPSAFVICLRLGWPLLGLTVVSVLEASGARLSAVLTAYGFLFAVPVNSYFQVRALLKKHLPESKRTRGMVLGLRTAGTVICAVAFVAMLVPPILLGACLIIMQQLNR